MSANSYKAQEKGGLGVFVPGFPNGYLAERRAWATLPPGPLAFLHRIQGGGTTGRTMGEDILSPTRNRGDALHVPRNQWGPLFQDWF